MKPNLFNWATSELSQDAFICWLVEWAKPEYKKVETKLLHETAGKLIKKLSGIEPATIEELKIKKQYKGMDVVIEINKIHAILIEDKVHAKHHGDQLARYAEKLKEKYEEKNVSLIYFKTGDQSNYQEAEEHRYQVFKRKCFLEILKEGINNGIKNDIYLDYYTYLNALEDAVNSYESLPIEDWDKEPGWNPWKGFYTKLQERLNDGNWDYVSQRDGGFLGFWWCFKKQQYDGAEYECYLQFENSKLCFKLHVEEKERAKDIKNLCRDKLAPKAEEYRLEIVSSRRVGKYMTLAYLKEDIRQVKEDGTIDMDATVTELKKMEELMGELWG
jgi:hypothetical protein